MTHIDQSSPLRLPPCTEYRLRNGGLPVYDDESNDQCYSRPRSETVTECGHQALSEFATVDETEMCPVLSKHQNPADQH